MPEYFTADFEHPISTDALRNADRETQLEVMKAWFRRHFEDPAECTPYEGGYVWIWGGPYDAREQLEGEFSGVVPDDVIDGLAEELWRECAEWAPTHTSEDYDEDIARISQDH